jgi:hypothetical protein
VTIIGTLPVILQNGTTADASQVMSDFNFIVNQVNANALATSFIAPGSILAIQTFNASGTYTPNGNASKALVFAIGGGGAGGGAGAPGLGSVLLGEGGHAGAMGMLWITAGLTSTTVTIGAAGVGNSGVAGNPGTATSFGTLMSCAGGAGGGIFGPSNQFIGVTASGPSVVTGTGNIILGLPGSLSQVPAICISVSVFSSSPGANSAWGTGGDSVNSQSAGQASTGFGAGGGGAASANNNSNSFAGGNGRPGYMFVLEFA